MSDVDPVKNLPAVVHSRMLRAQELARPMLGVRMAGDPRYDHAEEGVIADLVTRRAVQYASEILKRRGILPEDLSTVNAYFNPPVTIVFVTADERQTELAIFRIPDRVFYFRPPLSPRRIEESHD